MKTITRHIRNLRGAFWFTASMACDAARCDRGADWCVERAYRALIQVREEETSC